MKTAGVPTDGTDFHKLKLVSASTETDQHDSLEEGRREEEEERERAMGTPKLAAQARQLSRNRCTPAAPLDSQEIVSQRHSRTN